MKTMGLILVVTALSVLFNNCSPSFIKTGSVGIDSTAGAPGVLPGMDGPVADSLCSSSAMKKISVASVASLQNAVDQAKAGDAIEIQPGTYRIQNSLNLNSSGTQSLPICVRAAQVNSVFIESESSNYVAFKVSGAFWAIENLTIKGVCASDDLCEHAFQIKETANYTVIRSNTLVDFNAQIKGSSTGVLAADNVLIEGNHFFDNRPRQTSSPVTKIDVVGGKYWMVRSNFIHDFEKGQGDNISYAAFLKGYSRFGTFENNVVSCALNFSGGTRVGLSFGGGTTGPQYCWDYDASTGKGCAFEHQSGIMKNNLIMNCSDVGILIRDTDKSLITNNLVIDTMGIDSLLDAGHPVATSEVSRNIVHGQIRERNGAVAVKNYNLVTGDRAVLMSWFQNINQYNYQYVNANLLKDVAPAVAEVSTDLCGGVRTNLLDLGPFEFQSASCIQNVMKMINAAKR